MSAAEVLGVMAAFWFAALAVLLLARIARSIADDSDRTRRPIVDPVDLRARYAWAFATWVDLRAAAAERDPAEVIAIGRPPASVLAEIRRAVAA